MDLESVFSGGKPGKGESLSVWQAEIALRLSKLIARDLTVVKAFYIVLPNSRFFAKGVWDSHCSTTTNCAGVCSMHVCACTQRCRTEQVCSYCLIVQLVFTVFVLAVLCSVLGCS